MCPGPSALKPIWKPNSTSTPSTAPASDIGRAPRAPSSAGWKIRRIRPRRCRRIETSTSAKPSPTAACPSCPHACIRPGQRDANPSRTGLWLSSAHSATSLQSISNRNAVTGPGPQPDPPRTPYSRPPYPQPVRHRLRAQAHAPAPPQGQRKKGHPSSGPEAQAASPMRIVYPSSRNRLMIKAAVRNSVQPASGWAMEIAPPRRQLWEHSGKRAMQKRQRGNRHRR